MLLNTMIERIENDFPDLEFHKKEDNLICIPAKNPDVGDVYVEEDYDELTVVLGKFTHWHVGCYEDDYSNTQKANYIVGEVADFLRLLFSDQIVMWGSHNKSGGHYIKGEKPNSKSLFGKQHKEWVWSGPVKNS